MVTPSSIAKGLIVFTLSLIMCLSYIIFLYVILVFLGILTGLWDWKLPPDTSWVNLLLLLALGGLLVDASRMSITIFNHAYRVYEGVRAFIRGPDYHG